MADSAHRIGVVRVLEPSSLASRAFEQMTSLALPPCERHLDIVDCARVGLENRFSREFEVMPLAKFACTEESVRALPQGQGATAAPVSIGVVSLLAVAALRTAA